MKQTVEYFRQQFVESWDLAKHQWRAFTGTLVILLGVYWLSKVVQPGWATYLLMLPAALLVVITAYARLNAIGPELMGWVWQVRRMGFLIIGIGSITLVGLPFMASPRFPSWTGVLVMWGLSMNWLTTPNAVPWDWYLAGKYRQPPPTDKPLSPLQRLVGRVTREHSTDELKRRLRGEDQ